MIVEYNNIEENALNVKIGVTTGSVENRMKKLQTGNASSLHVVSKFETNHPFRLEKLLNLHYHRKRLNGEWFLFTDEDVVNFLKVCEDKQNVLNVVKENNPFF